MSVRIGLIARADNTGLGNQTWELYRHLKPARTYVIDLSEINAHNGKATTNHFDRFPDATIIQGFPDANDCRDILQDIDVLVTVEIPYNYYLFELAQELNVRTVLQYNYEFLDYLQNPSLPLPDLLLAPSRWHLDEVIHRFGNRTKVKYLPVPTATDRIPPRLVSKARHFLHVAGHKTYMDRNGTDVVLRAMEHVKSRAKITIHSQQLMTNTSTNKRLRIINHDMENYWDIYNDPTYDVLLLPRRYGGLSLQLNEALAAGMPVIMSDVEPQRDLLPFECLIGVEGKEEILTRTIIDSYDPDPLELAAKIDELYQNPKLVKYLSLQAATYGMEHSWSSLLPEYQKLLEDLLCQPL